MHNTVTDEVRVRAPLSPAHRNDVDGLRAVAVLAILAFHLDLAGFRGGFLGVDIFFVISGYVILRSILPDLEYGRFSLAEFFIRRVRRILPALMVVLAATLAAGFLLLSPAELQELAASVLATQAFAANLFFHDRMVGYFGGTAHTKPLLHMWSLGIEEQFYILVPLALAGLMRFRGAAAKLLIVVAVASFAYSYLPTTAERNAFYMPMARFWQIAIGGCIAVAERRWGLLGKGAGWAAGLGLLAIGAAVLLLESGAIERDGGGQQWAVIAVLGTAGVMAAGAPEGSWAAAALASRPMVAIGRISYSMYLVHWPLIVFWRLCTVRPLLPHEQALIAVLTVVLAATLSAFVEKPMRAGSRRIGDWPALAGLLTASAFAAAIGAAIIFDGGAAWRLQAPAHQAHNALRVAVAERPRCRDARQQLGLAVPVCRWNPEVPGTDFVIWGDSHARSLAPELAGVLSDGGRKSGLSLGIPGCPPLAGIALSKRAYAGGCTAVVEAVLNTIMREKPRFVVMHARWAVHASDLRAPGDGGRSGSLVDLENNRAPIGFADALIRTIERLQPSGAQVILVGPVPEIDYHPPTTLVRSLNGVGHLPTTQRADFDLRQKQVLSTFERIRAFENVLVVYPHTVLCDESTCAVADDVRSLYEDDDHLSPFGSARVSSLIGSEIARTQLEVAKNPARRMPPGE